MTEHAHTTSRRRLLGTVALAALALIGTGIASAVAAHAAQPDAGVLTLCTTFHRAHTEASDKANPHRQWATSAKQDALKQLHRMVPVTEAGHRAKAAVAASMLAEMHEHETRGGDPETRFALTMLRDWLGSAAA